MPDQTALLTHLSAQLRLPPEPLATEALTWLLRHPSTSANCGSMIRLTGAGLPESLSFRHQVAAADGARPDLVGFDEHGFGRLVVEVKFDAGLMGTQPVAYLRQAAEARDSARAEGRVGVAAMVLFIVPEQRLETLWPELVDRASAAWPLATGLGPRDRRTLVCEDGLYLRCISWADLLDALKSGLVAGDGADEETTVVLDGLRQLRGLVRHHERTSFAPLQSEDLTDRRLPVLWTSLTEVVRGAVDRVAAEPAAQVDRKGLTMGWSQDSWGMYLRLAGLECQVTKQAEYWRDHGHPLWLWVNGSDPKRAAWFRRAVVAWSPNKSAAQLYERDVHLFLALPVPVGAEREDAVEAVAQRLREVAVAIDASRPTA